MVRPTTGIRHPWAIATCLIVGTMVGLTLLARHPASSEYFNMAAIKDISSGVFNFASSDGQCTAFLPSRNTTANPIYYDQCHNIPTPEGGNFTAELCYESSMCNSFEVYITRSPETCAQQPSIESIAEFMSKDPEYTARAQAMGSDSFFLRTSGSERYGDEQAEYLGDCRYRFEVQLANRGDFFLEVFWIHGDYWAFREHDPNGEVTMRRRDLVFTQPLHIDICGSSCPITTSSPINATTFPYDPSPLDELPNCRAGEPAPGVYVPVNKFDADFFPVKIDNDQWTVANKYKFQPRECEWRHAGLKWADHEPCFERKRRVSIFGDSHARGLYDGLVHRMSGDTTFFRSSDKDANKNATFGELSLSFVWDKFGDDLLEAECSVFQEADVFIVGIGTWISWAAQSTEHYGERMNEIINHIGSCLESAENADDKILIYQTVPAVPPRTAKYWADGQDRRTNRRHYWWRDIGMKLYEEAGWDIIDYFSITQPFVIEPLSTDGSHYYRTDAHDALMDEVIGRSGFCDYR